MLLPPWACLGGETPPCIGMHGFSKPFLEQSTPVSPSPRSQLFFILAKLDARKERGVLMIWIMQLSGWSVAGCLLPFLSFGPSLLCSGMTGIPAWRELAQPPIYENQVPGHGVQGEQDLRWTVRHPCGCLRVGSRLACQALSQSEGWIYNFKGLKCSLRVDFFSSLPLLPLPGELLRKEFNGAAALLETGKSSCFWWVMEGKGDGGNFGAAAGQDCRWNGGVGRSGMRGLCNLRPAW